MFARLIGRADAGLGEAADRMIAFFALSHLAAASAGMPVAAKWFTGDTDAPVTRRGQRVTG